MPPEKEKLKQKIKDAQKYLKEAEQALKDGNEDLANEKINSTLAVLG